jgi:glucosamine--fructose-6-phosphate aminotransferase (isomerizing)
MTAPPAIDRFLGEILEQPAAMRTAARAVGEQRPGLERLHRLGDTGASFVLTGMGSSFDACLAAASVLARQGLIATPVNAAELLHFRSGALTAATPVLAISQSGSSAELVRLAARLGQMRERPPLVSLTNGIDNPLARVADIAFDMAAGTEEGPSTKTFAACLVLLRALADAIAGAEAFDAARTCAAAAADAERAGAAAARLLADPAGLAGRMRAWCGERPSIVILGRGTARAAAEMGALILKEAARRQAESLDTAEFRHGPLELSGPELAVAIVSTETATRELDRRLAAELARDGASVMMIVCEQGAGAEAGVVAGAGGAAGGASICIEELHPLLAPAVAVIPVQLLAWRLAVEGGRDPGRMMRASKVTTTE